MNKNSLIKLLFVSSMSLLASASLTACSTSYTVTFDTAGGTEVESITVKHGSLISKPETSRTGYDLDKWTCEGKKWRFTSSKVTSDITLVANWNVIYYSISYNLNECTLPEGQSNPSRYTIEDEITFVNPTREHYEDCCWKNGEEVITGIAKGTTGNYSLTASYGEYIAHNLYVSFDPVDCCYVSVNGNSIHGGHGDIDIDRGTVVTLKAVLNSGDPWQYWYNWTNYEIISTELECTFVMPDYDIRISASCGY